jgi:predicted SAM-dependent methyltransferase
MKEKLPYLNVGCGNKYHQDWYNVDMYAHYPAVFSYNLLKGIPFPDEKFEIVYHSQVLEHFPKEKAHDFMKECYRVLKNNGIIRVVVPDLENIVNEYKRLLHENLNNPTHESESNYDWIMLEMYDQTVRNYSGGLIIKYLQQEKMLNKQYVLDRTGFVGRSIRENYLSGTGTSIGKKVKRDIESSGFVGFLKKALIHVKQKIGRFLLGEKYMIGDFRLGGEIHLWMYDRYSLSRLLKEVGFRDIKVKNAFESDIPNWKIYELDVKGEMVYDPTSLFIEAKK